METVRESWTDERLGDFKERVEQRFDEVDRRFDKVDARFDRIDEKFERIDTRLDSMGRALVFGVITMSSTMVAGFGVMIGVIATKL
jgi:uncharacterized sporulation protein YeaH/YhbH (DUF444 family)